MINKGKQSTYTGKITTTIADYLCKLGQAVFEINQDNGCHLEFTGDPVRYYILEGALAVIFKGVWNVGIELNDDRV